MLKLPSFSGANVRVTSQTPSLRGAERRRNPEFLKNKTLDPDATSWLWMTRLGIALLWMTNTVIARRTLVFDVAIQEKNPHYSHLNVDACDVSANLFTIFNFRDMNSDASGHGLQFRFSVSIASEKLFFKSKK